MPLTPIKITLYGADQEADREFVCRIIPWGILKKAVALTKDLDEQNISEEQIDAIADLVVQAFGGQFSIEDLDMGADAGEMIVVLQAIVARASTMMKMANPTPLPNAKKSR